MVRRIYHLTKSSVSYRLEIMLSFLTRPGRDRKSTRLNSSHLVISYAVFCLKKKKYNQIPFLMPTQKDLPLQRIGMEGRPARIDAHHDGLRVFYLFVTVVLDIDNCWMTAHV